VLALPVAAVAGEALEVAVLVHNWDSADHPLGRGSLALEEIGFGRVCERPLPIAGAQALGIRAHFAPPGAEPFVERPFALPRLRVVVGEAVGIAPADLRYRVAVDAVAHGPPAGRAAQWFAVHDLWVIDPRAELAVALSVAAARTAETAEGEVRIPLAEVPTDGPLVGWWLVPAVGGAARVNVAVQWAVDGRPLIDADGLAALPIPPEFAAADK
jgi:hypothetical protein